MKYHPLRIVLECLVTRLLGARIDACKTMSCTDACRDAGVRPAAAGGAQVAIEFDPPLVKEMARAR